VKPDAYNGPVPSEGQFREFLTRLLRVPKREIDERERQRKQRLQGKRKSVKLDEEVTEEG
jgi:hypothetical protein